MSNSLIRCLIIDDDPFMQEMLQDSLTANVPEADILGIGSSGTEGIELIHQHNPDLIFLDVEMQDMNGFQMLAKLSDMSFQTIFITSFSHYAIKAIRFNALDYLMKPVEPAELKAAISRFKKNAKEETPTANVQQAIRNLNTENVADQVLTLQTQEGEIRMVLKNIIRIEAERNYSTIYLIGNRKKIASKTLADMEELLEDKGFFRSHKSHLINALHIQAVPNSLGIIMSDETEVPISRRKKADFNLWYQQI